MKRQLTVWVLALAATFAPLSVTAEQVTVAVATNFSEAIEHLAARFEASSEHSVRIVTGSTGKLYAQVLHGAPFDIYMSADQARPELLENSGKTEGRITYATGQLVLWSTDPERVTGPEAIEGDFRRLAIASPDLAPYGRAAQQVLDGLGVTPPLVHGENIGQTYTLVASGNAELGFVALSYIQSPRNTLTGSLWHVPSALHDPIKQDAVLLKSTPAAVAFFAFLQTQATRAEIRTFGYGGE